MKLAQKVSVSFLPLAILLMLVPHSSSGWTWQRTCPDVAERGYLTVLTINLLFSEIEDRRDRLETIADFIADTTVPVDVIVTQEVVGGAWSGTVNSAVDLKRLLALRGLNYNLRYRRANGLPGVLSVGNAVLSRCEIVFTTARALPFVTEEPFQGFQVPLRRKAMMCRIKIPGYGKINMYNVHLCAFCDRFERLLQTYVLLDFINDMEGLIWGRNPIILAGDFNIADDRIGVDALEYAAIVGSGFTDTYALSNGCPDGDCCGSGTGVGCTFGVSGNPYAVNPFTGDPEPTVRIDYIFEKGFEDGGVFDSVVVFNADPWVSDHSAVMTDLTLPSP